MQIKKIILITLITINIVVANTNNKEIKSSYADLIESLESLNSKESLFYLAAIYMKGMPEKDKDGKIIEKNIEKSIDLYKRSAELGNPKSYAALGYLFYESPEVKKNTQKAKEYFLKAYKLGEYRVATELAKISFLEDKKVDEGMKYLLTAAKKGSSSAQLMLSVIYKAGILNSDKCAIKDEIGIYQDKYLVPPTEPLSELYLTMACTNQNASDSVRKFCKENTYKDEEKQK